MSLSAQPLMSVLDTPPQEEVVTTITATTHIDLPLHPRKPTYAELNPRSTPTEFLGPWGTLAVTLLTPIFCNLLFIGCNERTGCPPSWNRLEGRFEFSRYDVDLLIDKLFDGKAFLVYIGWYTYMVLCWAYIPGDWVEGTLMRNGKKQMYKINAFSTLLLTAGLMVIPMSTSKGQEGLSWLYDHWLGLVNASILMAIFQSVWVYMWSFQSGELLAKGGNSGVFIYDFFMGRPLNPTPPGFPEFDIKQFNELRPGLILWLVLNVACLCEQSIRLGGLANVTASMWLVFVMQSIYVVDAVYNETSVLTTMDITTDGFGFMLAIGDLAWVPFTYTLQARYLAFHPVRLSPLSVIGIIATEATGYYIFRSSNWEKDAFRSGRNPRNLEFMQTKSGSKLLTSGWWGRSRHPNYFGDWLMALAWCLPTGLNTPITYFYLVFFVILLLHRQIRDDEACREKYGSDWEKYCEKVPYRIIPYVY